MSRPKDRPDLVGQKRKAAHGVVTCIGQGGGYVVARYPHAYPHLRSVAEFEALPLVAGKAKPPRC